MPRVIHFEFFADEPERAAKFYNDVFGWKSNKWGEQDYWLISTGEEGTPGINGGMGRRDENRMQTTNTVDVPSVDEYVEKIIASGGKVVAPKMPIPGVGYLAYCMDTESNLFGIMQSDPGAKLEG
jgi:predicted enzyme related to lactoylglutathione lyase